MVHMVQDPRSLQADEVMEFIRVISLFACGSGFDHVRPVKMSYKLNINIMAFHVRCKKVLNKFLFRVSSTDVAEIVG